MAAFVSRAADVCEPRHLQGPYAYQLSGMTTISGKPMPTVSLGRIVLDGEGNISGTASAMFSGLLLGNPITGSYEAKEDCSITWKLQDDSGNYQHFAGKLSPDLMRIQFRQTDDGGVAGTMLKTSDSCSSADLRGKYLYTVSGHFKAMQPGETAHDVAGKGTIDATRDGNFHVESDCTVRFVFNLPGADGDSASAPMNMRGYLVNQGKEILALQTDPGYMVSARLTESPVQ